MDGESDEKLDKLETLTSAELIITTVHMLARVYQMLIISANMNGKSIEELKT